VKSAAPSRRLAAGSLLLAACCLLLTACGNKKAARAPVPPPPEQAATAVPPPPAPPPPPKVDLPARKAGKPYVEVGLASWYGPPYHNRRAANGEVYNMHQLTAAHRTLPLNTVARVTNLNTGHSAIVRITDRGPFIPGRMLDLSLAAAKAVDVWRPGVAQVKLEVLRTPAAGADGGRWCVQIGAFSSKREAAKFKSRIEDQNHVEDVLQFTGPTGEWLRVRVQNDDKTYAEALLHKNRSPEGAAFLVRLD
jgi:rare lipoprotein A